MKPNEALTVLTKAMEQALASGLFKDFTSVNTVQMALSTINKLVNSDIKDS